VFRFQRGRDYFDLRETSGKYELNILVYAGGQYYFPDLKSMYKKEYKAFKRKHFFSKATINDYRAFTAELLDKEWGNDKPDFFGIKK
jgi:hypothetical protein